MNLANIALKNQPVPDRTITLIKIIFFFFPLVRTQQLYVGLSARKLIQTLTYRSLVLFKLFLLERKVLFFQSPVLDLCTFFLTLLSLHPGMLEQGLNESACSVPLDTPPDR